MKPYQLVFTPAKRGGSCDKAGRACPTLTVSFAIELELAAREDGTSTDERHSVAECAIWEAGIAYAKARL